MLITLTQINISRKIYMALLVWKHSTQLSIKSKLELCSEFQSFYLMFMLRSVKKFKILIISQGP
jgi:hypothetical protein